ncbi:hypothetical protein [Halorubrum sp. Atlit-26R]|uniref:hypothetical protein n=1 Tax=Halorubrum sp. Atlit-26R TaxID=2282128 RepID=UPI000EF23F09|nr:hypothetical protein [Halorubrum sp. Atlit-26R]RLM76137.1 hypothetical protein DVK07_00030 [Halorubrum sp. Atlit-26R]
MDAPEAAADGRGDEPSGPGSEEPSLAFAARDPAALDDATELYLLDRHAAEDGTVRVQLLGWERDGDVVRVAYALPTGERRRDRYRWPTAGRYEESDFLALIRGLGYSPAAADLVAGEFARARSENGRWRIVTGRRGSGRRGPRTVRDSGGARTIDARTEEGERVAEPEIAADLRRRVRRVGPMATGSASVVLFVLAVGAPASLAALTGGLTAASAALGGVLFAAAVATLGLSVAAVS